MWDFISDALAWLYDAFLWIPRKLWELILDGLATLLEAIPVPSFMSNLESFAGGIDPGIAYFAEPLMISTGVTFVLLAYVIRFVIRRIPVIG